MGLAHYLEFLLHCALKSLDGVGVNACAWIHKILGMVDNKINHADSVSHRFCICLSKSCCMVDCVDMFAKT